MLTHTGISALYKLLDVGCGLNLFPFEWDTKEKIVRKARKRNKFYFNIHKTALYGITLFSGVRLIQAMSRGNFPLLYRILNMVWLAAYILTAICFIQFQLKECEILQFVNCLLVYIKKDKGNYCEFFLNLHVSISSYVY